MHVLGFVLILMCVQENHSHMCVGAGLFNGRARGKFIFPVCGRTDGNNMGPVSVFVDYDRNKIGDNGLPEGDNEAYFSLFWESLHNKPPPCLQQS